jgi:two-component system response regulator FlrC
MPVLTEAAKEVLHSHSWPGNVRELENIIERAVLICQNGRILPEDLLMDAGQGGGSSPKNDEREIFQLRQEIDAEEENTLREMEKKMIFSTLDRVNWNKTKASRILGISVRTMRNKLNEYGFNDKAEEAEK